MKEFGRLFTKCGAVLNTVMVKLDDAVALPSLTTRFTVYNPKSAIDVGLIYIFGQDKDLNMPDGIDIGALPANT